jgi:Thermostable hemolysin
MRARQEGYAVDIALEGDTARQDLAAFVQAAFARQHGAQVRTFMPVLIGLWAPDGAIAGVAGYRPAAAGPLYLEQYLQQPIETRLGPGVRRADIGEIGNFACRDCVTARSMMEVLAEFLFSRDHDWAVFTATRQVRRIMAGIGIGLTELAPAAAACVSLSADDWGRYYATDPRVVVSHVPSWQPLARN